MVGRGRNRTISWFSAIPVENNQSQVCVMTKGSISYQYHYAPIPFIEEPLSQLPRPLPPEGPGDEATSDQ